MTNKKTITFRTATQSAIFEHELKGQFSDGHWENVGGNAQWSWKEWCKAKVLVGESVGRNFTMYGLKDNYNVSAKALLDVVKHRMIGYARLAQALGFEGMKHYETLASCDGIERPAADLTGAYWDAKRQLHDQLFELLRERNIDLETLYTEKDLMKDLREIKKAMKTIVQPTNLDSTTI